jgi:glycogen phosphorylase
LETAIFVMEMGVDDRIPTYSGGLGTLAGDMALSFADLGLPATFVTMLSRNGYASQKIDGAAGQLDSAEPWDWKSLTKRVSKTVAVEVGEKEQKIGAWEYRIAGKAEATVLFLDTDFPDNEPEFREASDRLYSGEAHLRLLQDIALGVGGYRMLKALGRDPAIYHLNESHAAFVAVELLRDAKSVDEVRRKCVLTTHTPIAAGHDNFPVGSVKEAFKKYTWINWDEESYRGSINLSRLAAKYSGVTNAVSLKHSYVSKGVIGKEEIVYVTNGVHHGRWVHEEVAKVFDSHLRGWRESPYLMVGAHTIPSADLAAARMRVKKALVSEVNRRARAGFADGPLTITIAKRITAYKRNGMILSDPELLTRIAEEKGEIQIVIAGKAHPRDDVAKGMLVEIIRKREALNKGTGKVKVAILENYDMRMAKLLVAGSDLWLNNPRRPLEACGTSGMKAAMNGGLNFSVHDGWWLEGGLEGVNGWGIGRRPELRDTSEPSDGEDEADLYKKLAEVILPTYYNDKKRWMWMSKEAIATVGPTFNSYRMASEYVSKVYSRAMAAF